MNLFTAKWSPSPCIEAKTVPDRHMAEDALSTMLPKLRHLDLTRYVRHDGGSMKANGGYCDVFVGHVKPAHVQHLRIGNMPHAVVKVAIKRLRVRMGREKGFAKTLAREIGIWARLEHANILPFLGYMLENDYPSLVSEWIDNGTIRDYMQKNASCDIMCLAFGIAKGLEYLHSHDIVHSDLKADNILISQTGEPLICDFGISRMLDSSQSLFVSTTHDGGTAKGSIRWMAIELHLPSSRVDFNHSKETDMWAYGMTIYEIISKGVPYAHIKQDLHVLLAIIKGELPIKPSCADIQSDLQLLWSVCISCWKTNPKDRPTGKDTVKNLEQHIRTQPSSAQSASNAVPWNLDQASPSVGLKRPREDDSLDLVGLCFYNSPGKHVKLAMEDASARLIKRQVEAENIKTTGQVTHFRNNTGTFADPYVPPVTLAGSEPDNDKEGVIDSPEPDLKPEFYGLLQLGFGSAINGV